MKRKNATRNALLMSVISMLLCVSMLVGTTFAWFTDEVTSGMNTIVAGNLDVEVTDANGDSIQNVEELFSSVNLWEPGVVAYENLTVSNEGTLALKYNLSLNFANENFILDENNEPAYGLSQVLKVAILKNHVADGTNRDTLVAGIQNWSLLSSVSEIGQLLPGEANDFAIVIWWEPSDSDNNWNLNNGKSLSEGEELHISLGVNVFATQLMHEKDSFDETYDKDTESFTIEEANKRLANNEDVTLINCYEQDGILEVPANYTGKLILKDSKIKSVQAAGDVEITILGTVVVNAKGTGAATVADEAAFNGTAVSANGNLSIVGNGHLTAIAADVKGASGIGGMNATSISITGITVDYAAGSYAYGVGSDTKYYKDAPEGGAAIGTNVDGAAITLDNVVVTKAIGGSKAAGIGARYHIGVTVNITDSTVAYVEGGVSAAGIGGSRVSGNATESGTTINISGSEITAVGGAYGAGIGSGYDTHCQAVQPLCTINISGSTINATGGKYAAGVGTGYHNAALAGEIKNSTVKAASGEKIYKTSYTPAMDIGFGVVDPTREGQQTGSKLIYNGVEITLDTAPVAATSNEELSNALNNGESVIVLGEGTFVLPNSAQGKTLTIIGSGDTVIATNTSGSYEGCNYALDGSTVVFENITITTDGNTYTGYARCNATYNNCVINNTYTLYGDSEFNNCTFNVSGDSYNLWTWGANEATFNDCTFNSDGKAILLYGTVDTKLTVNGCVFNDKGGLDDLKAAIEIGNDYGKSYELIVNSTVVNGYEINDKGISTGTTLWANKNSMGKDKLNVVVDGVDVY